PAYLIALVAQDLLQLAVVGPPLGRVRSDGQRVVREASAERVHVTRGERVVQPQDDLLDLSRPFHGRPDATRVGGTCPGPSRAWRSACSGMLSAAKPTEE